MLGMFEMWPVHPFKISLKRSTTTLYTTANQANVKHDRKLSLFWIYIISYIYWHLNATKNYVMVVLPNQLKYFCQISK